MSKQELVIHLANSCRLSSLTPYDDILLASTSNPNERLEGFAEVTYGAVLVSGLSHGMRRGAVYLFFEGFESYSSLEFYDFC